VQDNGIGMEADLAGRAFDLFAQGERNADRTQGGLGIGLALVKHLVELHGGYVTANSAGLGRGSEFSLTLPTTAPDAQPATAGVPDAPLRLLADSNALHVLLVDDNADAAAMLALIVEAAGHDVTVEHSAQAALRQAATRTFDACLLDIGLPDINGNELARRLRTETGTGHALLVAVTGYGQPSDRRASELAGFDHHFVKPVDSARLLGLLAARLPT
jgi:CheY-like chemotaxis protein